MPKKNAVMAAPAKLKRGFAVMTPEQRSEIARKGGIKVSRNKKHMAEIGRAGGFNSHGATFGASATPAPKKGAKLERTANKRPKAARKAA